MDATRALDLLILARAFVEAGWCQGYAAKDSAGNPVPPFSEEAEAFCVVGGFDCARWELGYCDEVPPAHHREIVSTASTLLNLTLQDRGGLLMDLWNDDPTTTKADVLALFDAACARVGKS